MFVHYIENVTDDVIFYFLNMKYISLRIFDTFSKYCI